MRARSAIALVAAIASPALLVGCESGDDAKAPGKKAYEQRCGYCHKADGTGSSTGPPLGKPWLETDVLGKVILQGVEGPIEVNGKAHDAKMLPLANLDDAEIASIMTYVQAEFGQEGEAVKAADVAGIRAATKDRRKPWTQAELLK